MIYGMFVRKGLNPALAEELVQQTVFDAVRGQKTFDETKGSIEQWITGIARNNLALEMRRRASRPVIEGDITNYLQAIDKQLLPDEVLEQKETAQVVTLAMDRLESNERMVLRLKYIEDLSARKIAIKMDLTEQAVHSLLYRARNALRDKLKSIHPLYKEEQKS